MRIRVFVVLAVLAAASVAVARADRQEETPLRMSFSLFPMQLGDWQGTQRQPFAEKILQVLGLDDYLTRYYKTTDRAGADTYIDVYIGYWRSQQQGGAIHSPQNCLPGAGWEPVSQQPLSFPDPRNPGGPALTVNRYLIRKGLERQLVLYWYQSRGRVVGSEYWSKIYLVIDAARYNRTDAALVRLVVPVANASPEAEAIAEQQAIAFTNLMLPKLSSYLPD